MCFPSSFTTWAENSSYITYRGQLPIYFRPCYTWRIIPVSNVLNNRGRRVRPLRIGLWDPFQMAELDGGNNGGDPNDPYIHWDPILQALGIFFSKVELEISFKGTKHTNMHIPITMGPQTFILHGFWGDPPSMTSQVAPAVLVPERTRRSRPRWAATWCDH